MAREPACCRWITQRDALREFVDARDGTTSQRHIKPLHWYVACRLCLEGGFDPDEITPRPPFRITVAGSGRRNRRTIEHDPLLGGAGEQTILGGLRTKQVDVVVVKKNLGPVIAVSLKGTLNAFRNLTNRLEEAGGDCTNLHLTYPSLVYAYWGVIRANRPGPVPQNAPSSLHTTDGSLRANDVAIDEHDVPTPSIVRYHLALSGLTARSGIRNEVSKYEAVALTLVDVDDERIGNILTTYPPNDSPLNIAHFMPLIYKEYDLRFVYQAPDLKSQTARMGWHEGSPALAECQAEEYQPRVQFDED